MSDLKLQREIVLKYQRSPLVLAVLVNLYAMASTDELTLGQIDASVGDIARKMGLSYNDIRKSIDRLSSDNMLVKAANNRGTTITLTCFEFKATASKKTPTKKDWKSHPLIPSDFEGTWQDALQLVLKPRREAFIEELRPYADEYGKEMCNAFYRYWTEVENRKEGSNLASIKMRFEKQPTWELGRRLITWNKNNSR